MLAGLKTIIDILGVTPGVAIATTFISTSALILSSMPKKNKNGLATREDLEELMNNDGVQLSKNIWISNENTFEHLCIIGPTGSGKSSGIFVPNLLQKESFNNSKSSIIVTDPKGEIYNLTSNYQRKLGRKIKIFSPYEENRSIHYNPLDFCKNESDVITLARDILSTGSKAIELRTCSSGNKDVVWINMATPLFASLLLYVWKKKKPYNTITNALKMLIDFTNKELDNAILESKNEDAIIQYKMFKQAAGSDATVGSIKVTLTSNIQSFFTPEIQRITAYTDFNFRELRDKKTILYIIYPVDKASDLASLNSIFFSQLFSNNQDSKKNYPLFCLFDELANIGQIPNFSLYCSTVRASKIGLICCLQDKSQLKALYGNSSETIYNNLKNICIYGGSKDYETLRSVSTLCGTEDVVNISTSNNNSGNTSKTTSYKTKPVMNIADIKNMNDDEILIMLKNKKPILDKQNRYYEDYKYLNESL